MVASIAANLVSNDFMVSDDSSRPWLRHHVRIVLTNEDVTYLDRRRPTRAISGIRSSHRVTSSVVFNGPSSAWASTTVRALAHFAWGGLREREVESLISRLRMIIAYDADRNRKPRLFLVWPLRCRLSCEHEVLESRRLSDGMHRLDRA